MIDDNTFNSLQWERATLEQLQGLTVNEVEPITAGYMTDDEKFIMCGIILYATDSTGEAHIFSIESAEAWEDYTEQVSILKVTAGSMERRAKA